MPKAAIAASGQIYQHGQDDHRPSQRPQHEQQGRVVVEVELQCQAAEHRHLEQDEPGPAREQVPRQLAVGLPRLDR